MNRETKRLLQRQGQLGPDGEQATAPRREAPRPVATRSPSDRTKPADFLREVRTELKRVAWPTKAETINSSIVVLVALIVLTAIIFGMDTFFAKSVLYLFKR